MRDSRLLTDDLIAELRSIAGSGASYSDLAWAVGLHPATLTLWIRVGNAVTGMAGAAGEVEQAALALGVEQAFAERARSLLLAIEQPRAEHRIGLLRRIHELGQDVPDGPGVPAIRGSLSALTFALTRAESQAGTLDQPAQLDQAGPSASADALAGLQARYELQQQAAQQQLVDVSQSARDAAAQQLDRQAALEHPPAAAQQAVSTARNGPHGAVDRAGPGGAMAGPAPPPGDPLTGGREPARRGRGAATPTQHTRH